MVGKYAAEAKKLAPVEMKSNDYQAKINAAKDQYGTRTPGALTAEYKVKRKEKDAQEARLYAINVDICALEQLAWDALEDAGLESVKLEGGGSFGVVDDVTVAIEDPVAFGEWIRDNDLEGLLTVNAQRASSLVKERLLAQQDIPPGVRIGSFKKTSYRR